MVLHEWVFWVYCVIGLFVYVALLVASNKGKKKAEFEPDLVGCILTILTWPLIVFAIWWSWLLERRPLPCENCGELDYKSGEFCSRCGRRRKS